MIKIIFLLLLFLIYLLSINIKLLLIFSIIVSSILIYLKQIDILVIFIVLIYVTSYIYKYNYNYNYQNKDTENFNDTIEKYTQNKENDKDKDKKRNKKEQEAKSPHTTPSLKQSEQADKNKAEKLAKKNFKPVKIYSNAQANALAAQSRANAAARASRTSGSNPAQTQDDINEELIFVLNSLLSSKYFNKNKKTIKSILLKYDINDIYELSDKIINLEKDAIYNNFLEKITCIKKDSDNVNYLDCDNENYKKIHAFSELIKVYTLSLEKVIELINKYKIYRLCDLSSKRITLLLNYNNFTSDGYEYKGLLYYLNEININEKYFKILELLELDKLLNNDSYISLREKLYYYRGNDKRTLKDLNSIIVIFDYYEIVDKLRLDNEEDDYDWNYGILKQIDLTKMYWDENYYLKKYDVKNRIINTINKLTKEKNEDNIFSHKLKDKTTKNGKEKDKENKNKKDIIKYSKEYKFINELNKEVNNNLEKEENVLKMLNIDYLKNNFSKVIIEIIHELINLSNKRCNLDCNGVNNIKNKIVFYFYELIQIFTKRGRLLYVGICILFISFMLYFIEISK